jgi:hypothetical protein
MSYESRKYCNGDLYVSIVSHDPYHNINITTSENINAMGINNLCRQNMWGINQNNIEITHHAKKTWIDIKEKFMTQTY